MTIRLNKVTRDLNVGISTVVEFLQKKGRLAVRVQSLLRMEKFPLTIQSVTTAADASRLARQMRGTQFTATLFHSADFSATQSTRVKQLFRLSKIKKNLWKSVMPLLTSLQKTQSRANALSLQSTE